MSPNYSLARRLPDVPRWVEPRASLLWERCEIYGLQEAPELSFVVRDPATELVAVIGRPALGAVEAAVEGNVWGGTVIAPPGQAARLAPALPEWRSTRAILHLLGDSSQLPSAGPAEVRFLDPDVLDRLPISQELLRDLRIGAEHSPIAATHVEDKPVSFCYAGAITESLWDISVDTLREYRRRGYAALCVAYMIRHMQTQKKEPVWGAVEDNPASWRLARKLGFVAVDEIALFEPAKRGSAAPNPR